MDNLNQEKKVKGDPQNNESLEYFARDLLMLIKSVQVYPGGHPSIIEVTARLGAWSLPGGRSRAVIGVTPSELVLDGRFYGGRSSRATELARLLYGRKIRTLTLTGRVEEWEWRALSLVLTDRALTTGDAIVKEFSAVGITSLSLEALELSKLHDTHARGGRGASSEHQGREIWLWLHADSATPETTARALLADDLWDGAESDREKAFELGYALSGLGMRLTQGLECLGMEERNSVLRRLGVIGREVTSGELSEILRNCPDPELLQGEGMVAMMGDIEGDKLIDVMAGLLAAEGGGSARLNSVIKNVADQASEDPLNSVRRRLKESDHRGLTAEVWKNLETLLINIYDTQFVDDAYHATLDTLAARRGRSAATLGGDEIAAQDVESHLDLVYLSLAVSVGGMVAAPWEKLFGRLASRAEQNSTGEALALAEQIDSITPYALESRPELISLLFRKNVENARLLQREARLRLKCFTDRHRGALLMPLFEALKVANRISQRRLLVDLASGLSTEATPALVMKARQGPWYLTRNLIIALGLRRDPLSLPYLASATRHEEVKVRREALRALAYFNEKGVEVLTAFERDITNPERDRDLARSLLTRLGGDKAR